MSSILGGFAGLGSGGIGRASVDLFLNARQYEEQLAGAEAKTAAATSKMGSGFAGFQQKVRQSFSGAQLALVGFGAVAAIAIGKSIGATQDWAAQVRSLQRVTGQTAEQASALAAAGNVLGIDVSKLNVGFGLLAKNIVNSSANLTKYGIATKDAQGNVLPFDQVLANVSDKFAQLPKGPEQAAFAMNVFGRSGKDLIPILSRGSEGLAELKQQAQDAGLIMSQDTLDASKELSIAQRQLGEAIKGVGVSIGTAFLPVAKTLVDVLTSIVELIQVIPKPILSIGLALASMAAAVVVATKAWEALKTATLATTNGFAALNPWVLAATAVFLEAAQAAQSFSINLEKVGQQTGFTKEQLDALNTKFAEGGLLHSSSSSLSEFLTKVDGVKDNVAGLAQQLSPFIQKFGELGLTTDQATQYLSAMAGTMKDVTQGSIDTLTAQLTDNIDAITKMGQQYAKGKISLADYQGALVGMGFTQQQAFAIANQSLDSFGQHLDRTGRKVQNFAGMTKKEFSDFKNATRSSMNFVEAKLSDLEGRAHVTARGILRSFDQALKAEGQFRQHSREFLTDIANHFPKLSQAAGDMVAQLAQDGPQGARIIQQLADANATQQGRIVRDWQKGQKGADNFAQNLQHLYGQLQTLDGTNVDINFNLHINADGSAASSLTAAEIAAILQKALRTTT